MKLRYDGLKFISILIGFVACVAAQQAPTLPSLPFTPAVATGSVQGKIVVDSDGSAVSGASISLVAAGGGTGAGSASAVRTFTSAADGTFTVAGLAAGRYSVCVRDPSGSVIDPCSWTDSLTTLTAAAGNTSTSFTVRVKRASTISVQVNDPAQALALTAADTYPPHVLVGAFGVGGIFHTAREVSNDASGRSFGLSVPVDSPVSLTVYSAQVKLTTDSNQPIPPQGYSVPFVQPSNGAQIAPFVFNAVGRN